MVTQERNQKQSINSKPASYLHFGRDLSDAVIAMKITYLKDFVQNKFF